MFLSQFISESHNKLAQSVTQLAEALLGVKHEQEFMEVRERVHRASEYDQNCLAPFSVSEIAV